MSDVVRVAGIQDVPTGRALIQFAQQITDKARLTMSPPYRNPTHLPAVIISITMARPPGTGANRRSTFLYDWEIEGLNAPIGAKFFALRPAKMHGVNISLSRMYTSKDVTCDPID